MHIDSYSFGVMVVDGRRFNHDLIIFPDRIMDDWGRKEWHLLQWEDLEDIVEFKPDVLIVGTGESGFMKIADEVFVRMKVEGIQLIAYKTKEALKVFNEMKGKKVGAFHLTC